jgi:hypothetical protein
VTSPLPTVASVTATAPAGAAYASAFLMVQAVATGDWLEGSSPMLLPVTPSPRTCPRCWRRRR